MGTLVDSLTSKTGIVAAVAVVLGILVAANSLLRPYLEARKGAREARPRLFVTAPHVSELAVYGPVRELRFEVGNAGKGTALMKSLRLVVTDHGASDEVRETLTAAPVTVHAHRVELRPGQLEYDIRSRVFGPEQPPLSFGEGETDAFVVKVVSREPHWFRTSVQAEWVDVARPEEIHTTATAEQMLAFPAEVRSGQSI